MSPDTRPALARGVKLQHDRVRGQWILQAPERVLVLDEIATAILARCTGAATLAAICEALARDYTAPLDEITGDVTALLQDLAEKGFVRP